MTSAPFWRSAIVFANYNFWLIGFAVATVAVLLVLPRFTPWFFAWSGTRVSEPQIKFVLLMLFFLGRSRQHRQERGRASGLSDRHRVSADLSEGQGADASRSGDRLHGPDPVLFSQGRLAGAGRCAGDLGRAYPGLPCRQDGRRNSSGILPLDPRLPLRAARRDVHDPTDVHRPDLRVDLGSVRSDQPHHRRASIYDPVDGGDRQRGGADDDRGTLVPAGLQASRSSAGTATGCAPSMAKEIANMYQKILVANDGSPGAHEGAVRRPSSLAKREEPRFTW